MKYKNAQEVLPDKLLRELENLIERGFVNARLRKADAIDVEDFDKMLEFERPRQEYQSGYMPVHQQMQPQFQPQTWPQSQTSVPLAPTAPAMQSVPIVPAMQTAAVYQTASEPADLQSAEKIVIAKCLEKNRNNISATAKELGMARNTLYQRIKKYGL